ncbi:TonB family protein [Archangium primigenium]|uniref:TonB family protein n=1 Tax=[Archangium] primigenium TaxID=2792470 RepID=UPI00195CDF07|nr:TonB family protein [Archangium primigenium]
MFQSVIHPSGVSSVGRFSTGVWVSLFLHAGVFGALVGVSHQKPADKPVEREVKLFQRLPPRGTPTPPTPQIAQPPAQPKPKPKPRRELVQPREVKPLPPVEPKPVEPEPVPEVDPSLPYIPGSHPDGDPNAKADPDMPFIGEILPSSAPAGTGEDVVPFGPGMTPPKLVSTGVPLAYTDNALRARVQGVVVVRCVITRVGDVENCRVIKGQPFMDEAVVDSLTSRRYAPLTFRGQPVNVSYTFNVNLRLP